MSNISQVSLYLSEKWSVGSSLHMTNAILEWKENLCTEWGSLVSVPTERDTRHLIHEVLSKIHSRNSSNPGRYRMSAKCAIMICQSNFDSIHRHNNSAILDVSKSPTHDFITLIVRKLTSAWSECYPVLNPIEQALKYHLMNNQPMKPSAEFRSDFITLRTLRRACYIQTDETSTFVSWEALKMVREKVMEGCVLLPCSEAMSGQSMSREFGSKAWKLIKWMNDECARKENGSESAKMLEPLLNGMLLGISDNFDNWEFANLMWSEYCDSKEFRTSSLYRLLETFTAPELVECQGLVKVHGYAYTDVKKTYQKIVRRTLAKSPPNPADIYDLSLFSTYEMCRIYFLRKKTWPFIRYTGPVHPTIVSAVARDKWVSDPKIVARTGRVSHLDFVNVEFEKNIPWDPCVNAWALTTDRGISPSRKRMKEFIDSYNLLKEAEEGGLDLTGVLQDFRDARFSVEETSLMAWMITHNNIDKYFQSSLEKISTSQESIACAFAQRMIEKAKELKSPEARVFGCMTPEMRYVRGVEQDNLKRLHRFFNPLDVMTTDDVEKYKVLKVIMDFMKSPADDPDHVYCIFFVDVSAWAESWTCDLVDTMARVSGSFMGTTCLDTLMSTFDQELDLYYSDGQMFCYGPKKVGPVGSNKDRGTTKQGQRQKTWGDTYNKIVKSSMLAEAERVLVTNNGDNLTAINKYSRRAFLPGETLPAFFKRQLDTLTQRVSRFGLTIKPEESTYSQTVALICKQVMQRKRCLGTLLKKIVKLGSLEEEDLRTTSLVVSNMGSAAHSACQQQVSNLLNYALYVSRLAVYFQDRGLNEVQMMRVMMRPSSLGGYAILDLMSILLRGSSDSLTRDIQLLRDLSASRFFEVSTTANWILNHTPVSYPGHPTKYLLTNPQGLPIDTPKPPEQLMTDKILEELCSCRNRQIRKMARLKRREKKCPNGNSELVSKLLEAQPFMPTLMSEIYASSEDTIASEFLQITKCSTIVTIFGVEGGRRRGLNLIRKMEDLDLRYLKWLCETPLGNINLSSVCTTKSVSDLRRDIYGPTLYDETYPPDVTSSWCIDYGGTIDEYSRAPTFVLSLPPQLDPRERRDQHPVLTRQIDISTVTQQKLLDNIPSIGGTSPLLRRAERMMHVIGNLGIANEDLRRVLLEYVTELCGGYVSDLYKTVTTKYSGVILHRLRTMLGKGLLSAANLPIGITVVIMSILYTAPGLIDPSDRTLNYALIREYDKILMAWLCQIPYVETPNLTQRYTITGCPTCNRDITDPVVFMDEIRPTVNGFLVPDEKEIEYACGAVDEHLRGKMERPLMNQLTPVQIRMARSVLAGRFITGKDRLVNDIIRDEGYHKVDKAELDAIKKAYGVSKKSASVSLNDLRSVPIDSLIIALLGETVHWLTKGRRMFAVDLHLNDIQNTPAYDLPFDDAGRDLIDSGMIQLLSAEFTRLGCQSPSPVDMSRVVPCRRYMLRSSIHVLLLIMSGSPSVSKFDSSVLVFCNDQDDDTVETGVYNSLHLLLFSKSRSFLFHFHKTQYTSDFGSLVSTLENLEISNYPLEGDAALVEWGSRVKLPARAKFLSSITKTIMRSLFLFDWWSQWGEVLKQEPPGGYPLIKAFGDAVIRVSQVTISRMDIRSAIGVCRANPDIAYTQYIARLRSTQVLNFPQQGIHLEGLTPSPVVRPIDIFQRGAQRANFQPHHSLHDTALYRVGEINRPFGSFVTSASKFVDVLHRYKFKEWGGTATLCEGSGGWARAALSLSSGPLFFNTLIDDTNPPYPTELMKSENVQRAHVYASMSLPSDMTKQETVRALSEYILKTAGPKSLDLITSDAEDSQSHSGVRQSFYITWNVIHLAANVLTTNGAIIIKLSLSNTNCPAVVALVMCTFKEFDVCRSVATHSDSNEVYVIARGLKNDAYSILDLLRYEYDVCSLVPNQVVAQSCAKLNIQKPRPDKLAAPLQLPEPLAVRMLESAGCSFLTSLNKLSRRSMTFSFVQTLLSDERLFRQHLNEIILECHRTVQSPGLLKDRLFFCVIGITIELLMQRVNLFTCDRLTAVDQTTLVADVEQHVQQIFPYPINSHMIELPHEKSNVLVTSRNAHRLISRYVGLKNLLGYQGSMKVVRTIQ